MRFPLKSSLLASSILLLLTTSLAAATPTYHVFCSTHPPEARAVFDFLLHYKSGNDTAAIRERNGPDIGHAPSFLALIKPWGCTTISTDEMAPLRYYTAALRCGNLLIRSDIYDMVTVKGMQHYTDILPLLNHPNSGLTCHAKDVTFARYHKPNTDFPPTQQSMPSPTPKASLGFWQRLWHTLFG